MQPEMKYIYTVYQCGSFSKAAEKLFLTQPALSISVQKVEHEVGMPLFNRDKKPLELTEAGMIYIQKIEQIQHLEQELAMQLNDLTDLLSRHDILLIAVANDKHILCRDAKSLHTERENARIGSITWFGMVTTASLPFLVLAP